MDLMEKKHIKNMKNSIVLAKDSSEEIYSVIRDISMLSNQNYLSMRKDAYITAREFHYEKYSSKFHQFLLKLDDAK